MSQPFVKSGQYRSTIRAHALQGACSVTKGTDTRANDTCSRQTCSNSQSYSSQLRLGAQTMALLGYTGTDPGAGSGPEAGSGAAPSENEALR